MECKQTFTRKDNKIDIDKFICSMIEHQMDGSIYKNQLLDSLKQQGIIYKDGSLQRLSNVEENGKNCEE